MKKLLKVARFGFEVDDKGNLTRVPLYQKLYKEVDDIVRPEEFRAENFEEMEN